MFLEQFDALERVVFTFVRGPHRSGLRWEHSQAAHLSFDRWIQPWDLRVDDLGFHRRDLRRYEVHHIQRGVSYTCHHVTKGDTTAYLLPFEPARRVLGVVK